MAIVDQEVINNTGTACSDLPADILEVVVTNLSTIDLLSASFVSNEWLYAVQSSLHVRPRLYPWLIVRCLPHPSASTYTIHALDPYSRTWLSVTRRNKSTRNKSLPTPNIVYSTSRDLLYTLSISQLVISKDPFGYSSQMEAKGPKIWRQNPVVAEMSRWVVVVGGGFMAYFDVDDDEGVVEVYDKETGTWELSQPMPAQFEGLACATWLSVAVLGKRLYVIDKKTGWISWFDPESKIWGPTCQLRPDPMLSNWAIGIAREEKLLLVGAGSGGADNNKAMMVRTWEVDGDTLQVISGKEEEVPKEVVDRLYPNFHNLDSHRQRACSVEVRSTIHGGYLLDPANMKNGVIMYQSSMGEEVVGRGGGKWEWVSIPAFLECNFMEKISVGCSPVSLHEVALCFL